MPFFFSKREIIITRNYDNSNSGFSTLPTKEKKQIIDEQKANSNLDTGKDLLAIFSTILLASIGYGILMVLISLRLEANIKNEILISLSAVTQIGAGVIFSRFLPKMGRNIGMSKTVHIGSIVSAVCCLALYQYFNYVFWLAVIYCLGTSFFICGVTRNTIMIDLAPSKIRALIISFGTMLVALGNAAGPIILNFLQTSDSFLSFLIASLFFLFSTLPLKHLSKVDTTIREEKAIGIWRYIKNSPKIMLAGFSVSFAMSSASAFIIIYGIRVGMSPNEAAVLLSILLFGTIFSMPVAYLADILNRRFIMILSAILSLICTIFLGFNENIKQIHILLFFMFACLSGIKIPAVVLINEKYKPTQRLAVNSAFSRFSLIGNICGLFCTGVAINFFGPNGLWISISTILVIFLFFCLSNYFKKIRLGEINLKNFSIFNQHQNEQLPDN
jgi:MFS family permease